MTAHGAPFSISIIGEGMFEVLDSAGEVIATTDDESMAYTIAGIPTIGVQSQLLLDALDSCGFTGFRTIRETLAKTIKERCR